jgi:hypothetical protein
MVVLVACIKALVLVYGGCCLVTRSLPDNVDFRSATYAVCYLVFGRKARSREEASFQIVEILPSEGVEGRRPTV